MFQKQPVNKNSNNVTVVRRNVGKCTEPVYGIVHVVKANENKHFIPSSMLIVFIVTHTTEERDRSGVHIKFGGVWSRRPYTKRLCLQNPSG